MDDLNLVAVTGRLTRDPELRRTPQGKAVCQFDLAVNKGHKGQDGSWTNDTTYITVVAWERQAESLAQYCGKGRQLRVIGSLKQETWVDANTQQSRSKITITAREVTYGDAPRGQQGGQQGGYQQRPQSGYQQRPQSRAPAQPAQQDQPQGDFFADDIPF